MTYKEKRSKLVRSLELRRNEIKIITDKIYKINEDYTSNKFLIDEWVYLSIARQLHFHSYGYEDRSINRKRIMDEAKKNKDKILNIVKKDKEDKINPLLLKLKELEEKVKTIYIQLREIDNAQEKH